MKMKILKKIRQLLFNSSSDQSKKHPVDFTDEEIDLISLAKPYTMTSPERIVSLSRAIDYIEDNSIDGDIVECGVWKGGSMMVAAKKLMIRNTKSRNIVLFDTFDGMSDPSSEDISYDNYRAKELLSSSQKNNPNSIWCYAPIEEVKENLYKTGYTREKIHFIKGKVEETLQNNVPDKIALLRLDTDWYESTYMEMKILYPRLQRGGILIVDDYGHWSGAKKAIDQYVQENKLKLFLSRIDYTGRIAVKV